LIKADVLVNSCPNSLKFDSGGALSLKILEAAGLSVDIEANLKYPNGITSNDVAITSAGKMKNCKKLFHIVCLKYELFQHISCIKSLTAVVRNCLDELKKSGFNSIAFPAIGTGILNYPFYLAAETMIDACLLFLSDNQNQKFDIKIIIFDTDVSVYKVYAHISPDFELKGYFLDFLRILFKNSISESISCCTS
jgi:O-acetyl-ADP-ribose deacetylase (regulator of RNase III)